VKRDPSEDCLVVIRPRFMSAGLGQRKIMQSATKWSVRSAPNPVDIQFVSARGVNLNLVKALQEPGERFCIFNLSQRIGDVERALAAKPSE
jgi:hypothetical protein